MPEIWKPVNGYEGSYEVSSLGRIRSKDRIIRRKNGVKVKCKGKVLTPAPSGGRYLTLTLGRGNTHSVHTLVARAFLGPCPDNSEVRHGVEGLLDNSITNLCYGTSSQNSFDRYRDGTVHNAKKVQCSDGRIFRSAHAAAKAVGVSVSCISLAANGKVKRSAGFEWEYIDA